MPRQLFAACQDKTLSLWGTTFGCFLGRYKMIDLETPVHRSKTCIVNFATDMLDGGQCLVCCHIQSAHIHWYLF